MLSYVVLSYIEQFIDKAGIMAEINLMQAEADALIAVEKQRETDDVKVMVTSGQFLLRLIVFLLLTIYQKHWMISWHTATSYHRRSFNEGYSHDR